MLLAVDVGNTNITFGLFKISGTSPVYKLVLTFRLESDRHLTSQNLVLSIKKHLGLRVSQVTSAAVASVVPPLDSALKGALKKCFGETPFFVRPQGRLPFRNLYQKPGEVGADRIVNALAAFRRVGGPAIVVDFGTATTFDCISKRGDYLGGLIVPGPRMASESLYQRTARLPQVAIAKPRHLIGKNTRESIQSGLYYGYASLVDGILLKLSQALPHAKILATGGLARLISGASKFIKRSQIFPDLTLEGIARLWFDAAVGCGEKK